MYPDGGKFLKPFNHVKNDQELRSLTSADFAKMSIIMVDGNFKAHVLFDSFLAALRYRNSQSFRISGCI
jgi:hypothetical protein